MSWLKSHTGFTMVELSLSLVFISTLSLTVVMVLANAISAYHKSITVNQITTAGTNLVDDIRLSIQQSSSYKLENLCERVYGDDKAKCSEDGAKGFVYVVRKGRVRNKTNNTDMEDIPLYGAFCTGTYSYIWNNGYYFNPDNYEIDIPSASLKYDDNSEKKDFKLLKVRDDNRAVCIAAVRVRGGRLTQDYVKEDIPQEFNITFNGLVLPNEKIILEEEPNELLNGADGTLALYNLDTSVSEQTGLAKNIFYYTSFILATIQGGVNIDASDGFCEAPEEYTILENFDYCAINKFNFAAMANGG